MCSTAMTALHRGPGLQATDACPHTTCHPQHPWQRGPCISLQGSLAALGGWQGGELRGEGVDALTASMENMATRGGVGGGGDVLEVGGSRFGSLRL